MDTTISESNKRVSYSLLEPVEIAGEVLFGTIMALSICAAAVLGGEFNLKEMFAAALGCNVAWGFVDGFVYLLNCRIDKSRRHKLHGELTAARNDQEVDRLLRELVSDEVVDRLGKEFADKVRANLRPDAPRKKLSANEWKSAMLAWLIVTLSTFPIVAPFYHFADPATALRVAQVIGTIILFGVGTMLGHWIGMRRWQAGLLFGSLGVAVGVICISLGG